MGDFEYAFAKCAEALAGMGVSAAKLSEAVEIFHKAFQPYKIILCLNKRVVHLARYGKKSRIRKKNLKRMKKKW